MTLLRRAATLAVPLAIVGLTLAGCERPDAKPSERFGEKVRAYLLEHPEVLMEATQKLQEKQAAQQAVSSQKAIGEYRQAIERDPRDIVINPAGTITVTEFFDYRCGILPPRRAGGSRPCPEELRHPAGAEGLRDLRQ